jgi:hypothetical protein
MVNIEKYEYRHSRKSHEVYPVAKAIVMKEFHPKGRGFRR